MEDLLRVKAVNVRSGITRNRVSVVVGLTNFTERDAAMPNPSCLIPQKIETIRQQGIDQVRWGVEQKCDAFRMFSVHREVERLFLFNPGGAKRQWSAFALLPARASHARHGRRI